MIEKLLWRYATKKFDISKKLSDSDLSELKQAVVLTPTSYGLQPFKVIEVKDPLVRSKLRASSWDQSQITDASSLFVFCASTDLTSDDIDAFLQLTATTRALPLDALQGYGDFMKGAFGGRTASEKHQWAARQAYIALGNLLTVAASKSIDVCPMEGFDPAQYNQILNLNDSGYSAVVVAAIGYRAHDDEAQHYAKVRKPVEVLFQTV